jgi:hypothetical protein
MAERKVWVDRNLQIAPRLIALSRTALAGQSRDAERADVTQSVAVASHAPVGIERTGRCRLTAPFARVGRRRQFAFLRGRRTLRADDAGLKLVDATTDSRPSAATNQTARTSPRRRPVLITGKSESGSSIGRIGS